MFEDDARRDSSLLFTHVLTNVDFGHFFYVINGRYCFACLTIDSVKLPGARTVFNRQTPSAKRPSPNARIIKLQYGRIDRRFSLSCVRWLNDCCRPIVVRRGSFHELYRSVVSRRTREVKLYDLVGVARFFGRRIWKPRPGPCGVQTVAYLDRNSFVGVNF